MIWEPAPYPWPEGFSSAAAITVDVDAVAPYLWQHRDGMPVTLSALEHRQYGMRRGFARMVGMLDSLRVKGTFFVPGVVAEENPALLPGLLERGHEIALHGYFHELVADTTDAVFSEALERSIAVFKAQTGKTPRGFRSPAWEMTPNMLKELRRHGLWDSSLMGEDVPYTIDGVAELPVRWDNDDAIFFKFLGAGDKSPRPDAEVFDQWNADAEAQQADGGLFMLTVHDWISGRAARVGLLERLLRRIIENETVWLTTCDALASHHQTVGSALSVEAKIPTALSKRERQ